MWPHSPLANACHIFWRESGAGGVHGHWAEVAADQLATVPAALTEVAVREVLTRNLSSRSLQAGGDRMHVGGEKEWRRWCRPGCSFM